MLVWKVKFKVITVIFWRRAVHMWQQPKYITKVDLTLFLPLYGENCCQIPPISPRERIEKPTGRIQMNTNLWQNYPADRAHPQLGSFHEFSRGKCTYHWLKLFGNFKLPSIVPSSQGKIEMWLLLIYHSFDCLILWFNLTWFHSLHSMYGLTDFW